jgi:hypothetical protein
MTAEMPHPITKNTYVRWLSDSNLRSNHGFKTSSHSTMINWLD